jgi:hypothetical protein
MTDFDQWEEDRGRIATSNDLKYIAWKFDELVDEVQGTHRRLDAVDSSVGLVAIPLWTLPILCAFHLFLAFGR